MARSDKGNLIGSWAFLIGVILAVILGIAGGRLGTISDTMVAALVVIGIIVGFFNIADEEVTPFLLSGAILVIVGALGGQLMSTVPYVGGILIALLAIFVPATIIVAIKNVFSLARR